MKPGDTEHEALVDAAQKLADQRTGIVLTGKITDGKVELDQRTLDAIANKFAGSDTAFVAVNAPFDPGSTQV